MRCVGKAVIALAFGFSEGCSGCSGCTHSNQPTSSRWEPPPSAPTPRVIPVIARMELDRNRRDRYLSRIRATIETDLDNSGGRDSPMSGHCGSAIGSYLLECDSANYQAIETFSQRTTLAVNTWSTSYAVLSANGERRRFELTVRVEGLADGHRVLRDFEHRDRNAQLLALYDAGVRDFGPPVNPHSRRDLNHILACVRGYQILRRLSLAIEAARGAQGADPPRLRVECDESRHRGAEHRGATIEARADLYVPLQQSGEMMDRLGQGGFTR